MRLLSTVAFSAAFAASLGLMMPSAANAAKKDQEAAKSEQNQAPKLTLSKEYSKAIAPAQKALGEGKLPEAKAMIDAAAAAVKSPDDDYHYGVVLLQYSIKANDKAAQRAALERLVKNEKTPAKDLASFQQFLGQTYLIEDKNYPEAVRFLQAAVNAGVANAAIYYQLAEAKFSLAIQNSGGASINDANKPLAIEGLADLDKATKAQMPDGSPIPAAFYERGYSIARAIKSDTAPSWGVRLVKAEPSKTNWHTLLISFYDSHPNIARPETLDLFRLLKTSGALSQADEYAVYADNALKSGLPGEAKAVLDAGRSAGKINQSQYADLYKLANDAVPKDKAGLAASEADAGKAANGKAAAGAASAFFGYGDDAKAIALYRMALQKGGVDANEVNTRLGIALADSGDLAGARAAFDAVQGPGTRRELADLWTLWLDTQAKAN